MAELIDDEEYLLRHIPGGGPWQTPEPRVTSANFHLRRERGETGVSVTRLGLTSPERLLKLVGGNPERGSRVARVRVGDVRARVWPWSLGRWKKIRDTRRFNR